jgi:type III pantothenate kinase
MDGMSRLQLVLIDVGNSRSRIAAAKDRDLIEPVSIPNADLAAVSSEVLRHRALLDTDATKATIIASVNDGFADQLASALGDQLSQDIYRVGSDLPVPIRCDLAHETMTGVDRLLAATAAFEVLKQACIVVDAGTAVTVDFIDGEGTFHGGAIAPGAALQLAALHENTESLPEIAPATPDDEPFGKSTAQAMLLGVHCSIRGMVRMLVERYADHYGAFPQVIVTGGDAESIFADDELIDRIVPDLTLLGMAIAAAHAMRAAANDGDEA